MASFGQVSWALVISLLATGLPLPLEAWSRQTTARKGPASAIGGYAAGCLEGAATLPPSGPGYEVLHLGRHRRYGHPTLVDYVRRLGALVRRDRLGLLLVGDLAQPRGGPTPTGHRSHQTGLDVDIGYAFPSWALARRPTARERESLQPPAVVDLAAGALTAIWRERVPRVLEAAASDPLVDRIFVHPLVKRALCRGAASPAPAWLRKIRPWWGHHDHFHVRLRCPPESDECEPQEPLGPDDGCGERLDWWFSEDARATRERRTAEQASAPLVLPERCQGLLVD